MIPLTRYSALEVARAGLISVLGVPITFAVSMPGLRLVAPIAPSSVSGWRAARNHLVKQYAQTEDVCASIQLLAASLLRRHITWRAYHHAGLRVRDSLQRRCLRVNREFCRLGQLCQSEV